VTSVVALARLATTSACAVTGAETVDGGADAPTPFCGAIDAAACFSNDDCKNPSDRCHLLDIDAGVPVICCAHGPRGTLEAGAPCASLDDCASAVCAQTETFEVYACSGHCNKDSDCPAVLPTCVMVNPSGPSFCGLPP
jgi:hypothetical protein